MENNTEWVSDLLVGEEPAEEEKEELYEIWRKMEAEEEAARQGTV